MTLLRQLLGKRWYQGVMLLLLGATLLYQKEAGWLPEWKAPGSVGSTPAVEEEPILVTRVIDGDTFEIEGGEKVRLIGIDTPETVKPHAAVECFGRESSEYLKQLIEGKRVRLERDQTDRDRYGRLLRYAYLDDQFVNESLVREGYAAAVSYRPDTQKQALLDSAENEAMSEKRGRFATGVCPK